MHKIILKPGKESSLKRFHPWVFSGAINKISGSPEDGDFVIVYSSAKECLGIGHYQPGSIAVRMLSFTYAEPDARFWKMKFEEALKLRTLAGLYGSMNTDVFRLVNAEGDGLPGLIADFYNGTVVLQAHSTGMYRILDQLAEVLKDVFGEKIIAVYDKSPATGSAKSSRENSGRFIFGQPGKGFVNEYGNKFIVDFVEGQKTGFFIDQRENRKLLSDFALDKKILNMFGYSGGFSVYGLRGGAKYVHTVDSSARAIELARENIALNFPDNNNHTEICSDVFDFFRETNEKWDIVILDPPAFAKSRKVMNNAQQAYKRLNARAIDYLKPGGLLWTFSCSQVLGMDSFRQAVYSAALIKGREVRVLYQLRQPPDHPVSIYHPEGDYLKGLILQVN